MRRRSKRRKHYLSATPSTHTIKTVRVAVPAHLSSKLSRSLLYAPPIHQRSTRSRSIRVPLLMSSKKRTINVRVAVPRNNRPKAAAMHLRGSQLVIRSKKYVKRKSSQSLGRGLAVGENHRRRNSESKRWRRRYSTGYLDSTRYDTGVLGANRYASAERIADAALVNSALGG